MDDNIEIRLMNQREAVEIADEWKYEPPYDFYDMTADVEDYEELIDMKSRADHYYSVLENQKLIGFFCVFPVESKTIEIELGLGLKPELTGKGLGRKFMTLTLVYIEQALGCRKVWLSVADFNQRAVKLYQQVGFEYVNEKTQDSNGGKYNFIVMNNFSKKKTKMR